MVTCFTSKPSRSQKTGAVKIEKRKAIPGTPMRLPQRSIYRLEDCPDGYCPTPPSEDRRPLERVRDLFEWR